MNRRTLLAALGSLLAAGCSQNGGGGSGEPGAYREDFGIGEQSDTPVDFGVDDSNRSDGFDYDDNPEFDFNSSQAGSGVNFDFDGDEVMEADSPQTLGEGNERATKYLVQARRALVGAIKDYAGFGGEQGDVTSVSPTTESFSQSQVNSKIRTTKQPLRKAAKYATERQKVYIAALEQTGIFLKHATEIEIELRSALSEYQTSMGFLYDADTTNYEPARRRLRNHTTEAREELDLINSETDSSALQIIGSDAPDFYSAKIDQFDTLIEVFDSLSRGIRQVGIGLADLKEGVKLYNDREYENASFDLSSSLRSFSTGKGAFEAARGTADLESVMKPGFGFVTVLYQLTEDLSRSAEAKTNYDDEDYVKYREKAVTHLKSDDRTRYMSEINKIQW